MVIRSVKARVVGLRAADGDGEEHEDADEDHESFRRFAPGGRGEDDDADHQASQALRT